MSTWRRRSDRTPCPMLPKPTMTRRPANLTWCCGELMADTLVRRNGAVEKGDDNGADKHPGGGKPAGRQTPTDHQTPCQGQLRDGPVSVCELDKPAEPFRAVPRESVR